VAAAFWPKKAIYGHRGRVRPRMATLCGMPFCVLRGRIARCFNLRCPKERQILCGSNLSIQPLCSYPLWWTAASCCWTSCPGQQASVSAGGPACAVALASQSSLATIGERLFWLLGDSPTQCCCHRPPTHLCAMHGFCGIANVHTRVGVCCAIVPTHAGSMAGCSAAWCEASGHAQSHHGYGACSAPR
jgi:hypothetical protein